jgi:hypothetical protein
MYAAVSYNPVGVGKALLGKKKKIAGWNRIHCPGHADDIPQGSFSKELDY